MTLLNRTESRGELTLFEEHFEDCNGINREYRIGKKLIANDKNIILESYENQIYPSGMPIKTRCEVPINALVEVIEAMNKLANMKGKQFESTHSVVASLPPREEEEKEELEANIVKSKVVEVKIIQKDFKEKGGLTDFLKIKFENGKKAEIKLVPRKWGGNRTIPNRGSNAEIFLSTLKKFKVSYKFDFDLNYVSFTPTLIGKICVFESEDKEYLGVPFKIWRVKEILGL